MTTVLLDNFDRVAADATTSPAGRWAIPTGGAWTLDGQFLRTATTFAASTRGRLSWTGVDMGLDYAEVRVRVIRPSARSDELGLFLRAHRAAPSGNGYRLLFCYVNATSRWELRWYYTQTAYNLIASVTDAVSGFAWTTGPRTLRLRIVPVNCATTVNTSACTPGQFLSVTASVDGLILFSAVSIPDWWIANVVSLFRGFGVEVLTGAAWVMATDYVAFDEIEFDDLLSTPAEVAPAIVADPIVSGLTVSDEGTASGTLPYTPSIGEVLSSKWFTVRNPTVAGYEITWSKFQSNRKLWRIGYAALTGTEVAALIVFLDAHVSTPFSYVDPDGATQKVCFVSDTVDTTRFGVDVYRTEFIVEGRF